MQIVCNVDGTIRWTATVFNSASCQTVGAYAVPLIATRSNGRLFTAQIQVGTMTFQPGTNLVQGDFCYASPPNVRSMQAYFALLTNSCRDSAASNVIAPCPVRPTCPLLFPDVQPDHKFYTEITSLAALDVVSGYEDGTFRPEQSMTRGASVKVLVQAFDISLEPSRVAHFSDVPPGSPYFAYIEAAYKKSLVNGYADGTFKAEQAITRGALVKMVVQAAGWELVHPQKPTFSDVTPDSPFYPYVEAAAKHVLLDNVAAAGGSFQADNKATRGESAAIIARAMPPPTSDLPKHLEAHLKQLLAGQVKE
jgi:hypothetical protein